MTCTCARFLTFACLWKKRTVKPRLRELRSNSYGLHLFYFRVQIKLEMIDIGQAGQIRRAGSSEVGQGHQINLEMKINVRKADQSRGEGS